VQRTLNQVDDLEIKYRPNFVGLHNLAQHMIHLKESSEAVLRTVESLRAQHDIMTSVVDLNKTDSGTIAARATTKSLLAHRYSLFQSTNLRINSLEKRMQNVINLV
jgi:hypothetical protein